MGETQNIAKLSETAFGDIFKHFGWTAHPLTNARWKCEGKGHLTPTNRKTYAHPTDAVYFYQPPYREERVAVNIDFKSYSKDTLERLDLSNAVQSLARSVECANRSEQFQQMFLDGGGVEVVGLLFVFNHDNKYEPEKFARLLTGLTREEREIGKLRRLFIMGPADVAYLLAISNDMLNTHAELLKANRNFESSFFFPHLMEHPVHPSAALSLEALTGPWQIIKLAGTDDDKPDTRYHIYCRAKGSSVDELEYMIDYMFRYQLVAPHTKIWLRLVDPDPNAATYFDTAKRQYAARSYGTPQMDALMNDQMGTIQYQSVRKLSYLFSEVEAGMKERQLDV
jgi:hypothetical protein